MHTVVLALTCLACAGHAMADSGKAMSKAFVPARTVPLAHSPTSSLESKILSMEAANEEMRMELERVRAHVENMEKPEAQAPTSLKLGLVGIACASVLALLARSQEKRQSPAASVATLNGAELQPRAGEVVMFDPREYAGVQAPTGFWDPLNLAAAGDESEEVFLRRRAVEVKHGRVAMLCCLGYIAPYFTRFPVSLKLDGSLPCSDISMGVKALYEIPALGLAQIVLFCGALELGPFKETPGQPGDVGWDPLSLKPDDPEEFRRKQNIELANGRLAMFGSLGFIAGDIINNGNPYVGGPFTP